MSRRMPPRRTLKGVVSDAILDREGFVDAHRGTSEDMAATLALIERYRAQLARLDDPRPLDDDDRRTIARATGHARIWRVGLLDAWKGTGDRASIAECRNDVARLEGVERALGVVPSFLHGGPDPEGTTITIQELSKRLDAQET